MALVEAPQAALGRTAGACNCRALGDRHPGDQSRRVLPTVVRPGLCCQACCRSGDPWRLARLLSRTADGQFLAGDLVSCAWTWRRDRRPFQPGNALSSRLVRRILGDVRDCPDQAPALRAAALPRVGDPFCDLGLGATRSSRATLADCARVFVNRPIHSRPGGRYRGGDRVAPIVWVWGTLVALWDRRYGRHARPWSSSCSTARLKDRGGWIGAFDSAGDLPRAQPGN